MTWIQTSTGRAFDLIAPNPDMVDLAVDVPEALARIARFNGHVRSGPYSVAQHSVIGADLLMRETGNREVAAAFLLHDAHEAYVGDMATPMQAALASYCQIVRQGAGDALPVAINRMKTCIDAVIHSAAGVRFPLTDEIRDQVKRMDVRMLRTERDHLLSATPMPWRPDVEAAMPLRLRGKIKVQPWAAVAAEFVDRLHRYCPMALARAA